MAKSRKLTAASRRRMKSTSFGLPKQRKYPLDTIGRARNALNRVSQHGTSSEQAQVGELSSGSTPASAPSDHTKLLRMRNGLAEVLRRVIEGATLGGGRPYGAAMSWAPARNTSTYTTYPVPIGDLTDRQLLLLILDRTERQILLMADLQQAVADLGAAVAGVTARLIDRLQQASDKIVALQEQADNLSADDAADKAAIQEAAQQVQDLVSEAADAAAQIESQAAQLNQLAPSAEPPPAPEPV